MLFTVEGPPLCRLGLVKYLLKFLGRVVSDLDIPLFVMFKSIVVIFVQKGIDKLILDKAHIFIENKHVLLPLLIQLLIEEGLEWVIEGGSQQNEGFA